MLKPRSSLSVLFLSLSCVALACGDASSRDPFEPDAGLTMSEPAPIEPESGTKSAPNPSNPDEAAAPEVDGVSPNKAAVGSVGPLVVVTGDNFVPRSIVQLDGAPLATSFVSGTELRATIPSGKLAAVGVLRLSVGTAPPGGGASKEVTFAVENPAPQVLGLAPLSVLAGSGATKLVVSGASFVPGATIAFGGAELATTLVSSTELEATIPAALLAKSGSVPVTVANPAPGGGKSSAIAFTISNPSASVDAINPSAAFVGSAPFEMTVAGAGFVPGSAVLFNGASLTTTLVSPGTLKAQVPASALTAAGDFPVTVQNPPPGGGVSAPVVFRVQYPVPTATSLSPSSIPAGSGATDVTVTGIGFFATTQITFDNAPAATTYIDATHVKATLSAGQVASAGSIAVRVMNPMPGGGSSAALAFTMTNGVPTITSLTPSWVPSGSPDRMISLYGSAFLPGSTVKSNGQLVAATYVSGSQLTATIPAAHMINAGKVGIVVTNPAPGGGTSGTAYLTVGCDATGVSAQLTSIGATIAFNTEFARGDGLESRISAAGACPTTLTPSNPQPGRYATIQNATGVPVTLSAWADCTNDGKGDAFLTFYRRSTFPADDTERLACASVVSEGKNGVGGYASPDSGGSTWCPGLTKANGGGLQLAVCETAVVHIQPWGYESTSYTPPPILKVRAE